LLLGVVVLALWIGAVGINYDGTLGGFIVLLVVLGLLSLLEYFMNTPASSRTVCTTCGKELYGKWWNDARRIFECRHCGSDTYGRVIESAQR
jgi:hypothetical protein